MRVRAVVIALLSTLAFGGCAVVHGIVAEALAVPVESKAVAAKWGSGELIATDGTYCFVSRGRFSKVVIGDHVLCAWSSEPRPDPRGTGSDHIR